MSLQRMNASIELKKKHDRGIQRMPGVLKMSQLRRTIKKQL